VSQLLSIRPNLEVDDLEPTVTYLRSVLDFQVDVEEKEMGPVLMHRDGAAVAIVRTPTRGVNATTSGYIGVTNVDDLHRRCVERGAAVVIGLTDHPWGLRDFVVEIPGGHKLAFGERIAY